MNGGLTRCADPPIRLVRPSRKQNFECFCNFFAIRDSLLSVQSGNGPFRGRFAAFSGLNLLFGVPRQSLIAKKLQIESHYCFRGPKTALSAKLPRGTFACIANWCINEVRKTKKGLLKASLYHVKWCPRRDLNPHVFRQRFLRPPRLPFRHSGAGLHYT